MTNYFVDKVTLPTVFFKITSLWNFGLSTSSIAFDSPAVRNFIENDRTPFDLVISEQFQQESFNMFAHKYKCQLITIATLDYADFMDRARGALTPWSHVPHFLSYFNDQMNFIQRFQNTIYSLYDALGRRFYYMPKQNDLARKAFASLENQEGGRLPSVEDLEKRIAAHLINNHPILSYPRPKMPGMADIAGVHIKPTKPLPADLKKFLDEAENGVIYVSFGSFLRSADMPSVKYEAMLETFRKLKQRVLWKWESDEAPNLPANVMVRKWMPQSDILAHKNIKLFIAHGGIFGTQEAIYHGVPMILFPFYGDQHLNSFKIEGCGIGLVQSMADMTSTSLSTVINRVISNETFYQNIDRMSKIFTDNQNNPLDTAIWWIEYIIRYKGAQHIQSPAKNISWFRYLQLDLVLILFSIIYMIYDAIKQFFILYAKKSEKCEKSSPTKNKNKNKKKEKEN